MSRVEGAGPKPGGGEAQRTREHVDPDEGVRPLPWFFLMFLGAMAMWGAFYIYVSPSGADSALGDERTVASLRPAVTAAGSSSQADGKQIFGSRCAACHQATGQGLPGVFPPLAGSEWVLGDSKVLSHILLHGINGEIQVKGNSYKGAMPAWNSMSDDELAAVMTYIRSEWGNGAPTITADLVKAQREATKTRTEPYKGGAELTAGH